MDYLRKLKNILYASGLTEEEVAVFISVFKNPNNSIYFYTKQTKLPKDKVYKIVQALNQKGLITLQGERTKKLNIGSLDNLEKKLDSETRKLTRVANELKQIKNFLPALKNSDNCIFETFSFEEYGEKFIDLTYYKNWNTILGYGDFEYLIDQIGISPDQTFVKRRVKKGAKCLPIIANPKQYCLEYILGRDQNELRRTKTIQDQSISQQFVTILPELDIVTIWSKNGGINIQNKMLSKVHQDIFKHFDKLSDQQFSLK